LFAGDDFVRGLRAGELGPDAVVSTDFARRHDELHGVTRRRQFWWGPRTRSYRARITDSVEGAGFFRSGIGDLASKLAGPGTTNPRGLYDRILHASTGIQLQWIVPGIGVPVRAYYAVNVLRLDRWLPMPDGALFHAHDRFSAFGWGLGSLF